MADLKSLREKRGKFINDARAILDAADAEGRALTTDEQVQYDTLFGKADEVARTIDNEVRAREAERELAETAEAEERAVRGRETATGGNGDVAARQMDGFRSWLRGGQPTDEFRALSAGVNTDGGYLVMPEQFVATLIKAVDDAVFIRSAATVIPMAAAQKLGVPTLDADPSDADWTSELQTGSEDSAMKFGKRQMEAHPLAKRIKISKLLLRNSALPAEALVRERLAYKFSITMEKNYLTGDGNQKPLGVFTASPDGIPTSRDVSEDNTASEITADGLISTKYSLKSQYWMRAQWLFHRDAMKQIAKLKDSEGQYLWRESVRDGEPDRLLGRPVMMSEYAPNTFAANQYVGILGDFSNYWIADSLQMQMPRLTELYAETNQDGFIGRYEGDGAPVLAEAFARVKLAAS